VVEWRGFSPKEDDRWTGVSKGLTNSVGGSLFQIKQKGEEEGKEAGKL